MNVSKTLFFCLGLILAGASQASDYDEALASELGADDYGMKSYVLVILKTGEKDSTITDKEERGKYFKGHFDNMGRLAEEGKLVVAGPLAESPPKRGIFILNVETLEEAEKLVNTDPAVKAGIFTYSLSKFYGSAALMKVNEIHKTIQKKSI